MFYTPTSVPGKWAKTLLMAGLREVPYVGKAVKVYDNILNQRRLLTMETDIGTLQEQMTRAETRFREVVRETIADVIEDLRRPGITGDTLHGMVRELRHLQDNRYNPMFFDGLLTHSNHYAQLKRCPENYGKLLDHESEVAPGHFPIFVDLEESGETRILEVSPAALQLILSAPQGEGSKACFLANPATPVDVWAAPELVVPGAATAGAGPGTGEALAPSVSAEPVAGYLHDFAKGSRLVSIPVFRPVMVGRNPGNDCVIVADAVSGAHARIGWDAEQGNFWVEDLHSTNGTWLGPDHRLPAGTRYPLGEGQCFYLGDRHVALMIHRGTLLDPG